MKPGILERFIDSDSFRQLSEGYSQDVAASKALAPALIQPGFAMYQLPNTAWARRVSGVFSNDLVRAHPARAHAVLTEQDDGAFLVSVRAPFHHRFGAEKVCAQFETGGGRAAAARNQSSACRRSGSFNSGAGHRVRRPGLADTSGRAFAERQLGEARIG